MGILCLCFLYSYEKVKVSLFYTVYRRPRIRSYARSRYCFSYILTWQRSGKITLYTYYDYYLQLIMKGFVQTNRCFLCDSWVLPKKWKDSWVIKYFHPPNMAVIIIVIWTQNVFLRNMTWSLTILTSSSTRALFLNTSFLLINNLLINS